MKRSGIRRRSPARQPEDDERRTLREAMFAESPYCQIGPVTGQPGCGGEAQGLHERRKRSAAGSVLNPANVVRACNWCNGWVEDHPAEAHRLGLVLREGDPGWDAVSRRHDRFR